MAIVAAATLAVACSWHRWVVVESEHELGFSPLSLRVCIARSSNFDVNDAAIHLGSSRSQAFPIAGLVAFSSLLLGIAALVASALLRDALATEILYEWPTVSR